MSNELANLHIYNCPKDTTT